MTFILKPAVTDIWLLGGDGNKMISHIPLAYYYVMKLKMAK